MAKSIRSKVKRSFRAKKRETGKYAAAEAARLNRLNTKLAAVKEGNRDEDIPLDDAEGVEAEGHPEGSWDSEKLVTVLGVLHPLCVTPRNLALLLRIGEWGDGLLR
jgi:hypothetical protein